MFVFKIENWKNLNNQAYFNYMLDIKDWDYQIKEYKKTRSNDQNRYYWGWVLKTIAESMWDWADYVHWVMSMKFLVDNTKKSPYIKSTANLNSKEFTEYIENIKDFVAPFGIIIPSADEFREIYW